MEREVSLPFSPPPAQAQRHGDAAEILSLRREVSVLLEQRVDEIAASWENEADAAALVCAIAAALATEDSIDDALARGAALGASAFEAGLTLERLLRALDRLEAKCLEVVANAMAGSGASASSIADGVRLCRRLRQVTAAVAAAAARRHGEAADRALQERFRRLRHDLRNPLGTIRSALSLMTDETVPEEARRSPRFRTMIERNTTALDQMIVTRLGDGEAHVVPAPAGESSAPLVVSEASDDLARPRERDDRQAGSL